ncbi:50S ribosomal protein L1 [Candidatus Providencia siddallii]|uniref:Large ribosomal subunit protein uL1 n=1 Tax=Candidatus Providencia siddallii TaxID=1715285 RepID=A0ABM9NNJ3_9GAMM
MTKLTKRMQNINEKIDKTKQYNIDEAICLLKEISTVKFIESIDVAINLGIDPRKSNQNIRGTIILPHGTGRKINVAVFAQGKNAEEAKIAGADLIGMEDIIDTIKNEKIKFDVVIASPEAIHVVSKIGQFLGPRGLMPNPKFGTVTTNIFNAVKNAKSGQIRYKNDKNGIIHTSIGKINFSVNNLKENLKTLLNNLKKEKPNTSKGIFIKKITLSSTMTTSLIINQTSLLI